MPRRFVSRVATGHAASHAAPSYQSPCLQTDLPIHGVGFPSPSLPGSECSFLRLDGEVATTLLTPLETKSSSHVVCKTPAAGYAGTWAVEVLLNGMCHDPYPFLARHPLSFICCS